MAAASGGGAAAYRCFLFADLRGYTSFIESAGNAAGVVLLDEYLSIARSAVAQHNGAEVKVEGDGFHAVFPSASSAVMCGLAIVDAAAEATASHLERPINVGIGVHAGEAVETAQGYIGSAVNIAARVCGIARSGEVLVTSTVRDITQASIPVAFATRGRPRLKGITDSIELFAVTQPSGAVSVRRGAPGWARAVGAIGVVGVIVVLGVIFASGPGGRPAASKVPSAAPSTTSSAGPTAPPAQALAIGPLDLGRYEADQFVAPFSFLVDEPGWAASRHETDATRLLRTENPTGDLYIARVDGVFTDACNVAAPALVKDMTPDELVAFVSQLTYLDAGEVQAITIDEHDGFAVDVTIQEGVFAACTGVRVKFLVAGEDEPYTALPGQRIRMSAIDVEGQTIAFLTKSDDPTGSALANEAFHDLADRIIDTIDF